VITDIGYPCKRVIKYFSRCHAAFLESNYCEDMLMNGSYPAYLKKRISSDEGHLSNTQALELFINYRSPELQLLILSHLSKNNNKPELVQKLFAPYAADTKIVIASRYEASKVFEIGLGKMAPKTSSPFDPSINSGQAQLRATKKSRRKNEQQLSLF
jgi:hypothetical protein